MDESSFDNVARLTAAGAGRRGVLRSARAVALGGSGRSSLLETKTTLAKKNKKGHGKGHKKGKGKKGQCLPEGQLCGSDNQCCFDKTKLICEIPFGASN